MRGLIPEPSIDRRPLFALIGLEFQKRNFSKIYDPEKADYFFNLASNLTLGNDRDSYKDTMTQAQNHVTLREDLKQWAFGR